MGNIVKSASSVYPKKECYAVGAKPKLGRGSKRKKQLQQQGQSSKAVDGICSPSPLHLNGLICRCYIFLFFSLEVIFASQGSLVHSTPQKWSGLKILGFHFKTCKMEDKNLEHIFLSLFKKCVGIKAISEELKLQDLYFWICFTAQTQATAVELDFRPSAEFPALQYLDSVDPGSRADRAGLKTGDFILEVCPPPPNNFLDHADCSQ